MTDEELYEAITNVSSGKEFNEVQRRVRESGLSWETASKKTQQAFVKALKRIETTPEEFKGKPHIHYEVARRKRENESV